MLGRNRLVLLPWWVWVTLVVGYAGTFLPDLYAYRLGVYPEFHQDFPSRGVRLFFLCIAAVGIAGYRVANFHPALRTGYQQWLMCTAWEAPDPLPLGPYTFVWVDGLWLVPLTLLAFESRLLAFCVPLAAMGIQTLWLCIAMVTPMTRYRSLIPILALFPLMVMLRPVAIVVPVVIVASFVWASTANHRYYATFPWNTRFWTSNQAIEMRAAAARLLATKNAYNYLMPDMPVNDLGWGDSLTIAILAGWYAYAVSWGFAHVDKPCPDVVWRVVLVYAGIGGALFRYVLYGASLWPPTSLAGRRATGQWLIPKFDSVLIAPFLVAITGIALPWVLLVVHIDAPTSNALTLALVVLEVIKLPPSREKWRAVGAYRVLPSTRRRQAGLPVSISYDPPARG